MVRQTSISTFKEIEENGLLSKKQLRVYEILYLEGPMTGGELAQSYNKTHGDASRYSESIRNRLTELFERGVAAHVDTRKCNVSGRRSIVWDVTKNIPGVNKKEALVRLTNKRIKLEKQLVKVIKQIRVLEGIDAN